MLKRTLKTILCVAGAAALMQASDISGRRVPSFALPDLQANYHDIMDLRGKPVVVEIMQTNCPHCQELTSHLEKIEDKYGSKIAVLAIVVPPDNADTVKQYIARFRVHYPVLFDCGQATAALLRITPQRPRVDFPVLLLIDAKGTIREDLSWVTSSSSMTVEALSAKIDALLNDKPAAKPAPKAAAKAAAKK